MSCSTLRLYKSEHGLSTTTFVLPRPGGAFVHIILAELQQFVHICHIAGAGASTHLHRQRLHNGWAECERGAGGLPHHM